MPTDTPSPQSELQKPRSGKFRNPDITESGAPRAKVTLTALETLWFNTGTLCNITCRNCYIESSPKNDRLAYVSKAEVRQFLDEVIANSLPVEEIGLTGGEPFMNPDIMAILADCLDRGYRVLVLSNGMKPMMHHSAALMELNARHGRRLVIRLSVDHYTPEYHVAERGSGSWEPVIASMRWLHENGLTFHVAGRTCWGESEESLREGYAKLFAANGITLNASNPVTLVLFPEMDTTDDVPEVTEKCWDILGVSPDNLICSSSRMVVKHKGADALHVMACTLIAYEEGFRMGPSLSLARTEVSLNHPHCASFCVLGGGSCSK
ncbi:MAG TPA: radical SAM protein [Alphaproteobacteria bacterium]|nr:radical SAM protein [Alphaproteobacteria bacterium]